jgi:hypothetical protein
MIEILKVWLAQMIGGFLTPIDQEQTIVSRVRISDKLVVDLHMYTIHYEYQYKNVYIYILNCVTCSHI